MCAQSERQTIADQEKIDKQSIGAKRRRDSPEMAGVAEKAQRLSIEPNGASRIARDQTTVLNTTHGYANTIGGDHGVDDTGNSPTTPFEISEDGESNLGSNDEHANDSVDELSADASAQAHRKSCDTADTRLDGHDKERLVWEDLPVVLQVPGKASNDPFLYNIDNLPEAARSRIRSQWNGVGKFATYKHKLDAMLKYYRKNLGLLTCLRTHIIPNVQKRKSIFNDGGVSKESACDQCIRNHVPCTYLIEVGGNPTLCVVPLPEGLRVGKEWRDVEFWVMPSWKK
jgi:hypothetical protein